MMKSSFFVFCCLVCLAGTAAQAGPISIKCNFLKDFTFDQAGNVRGSWDGPVLFDAKFLEITNLTRQEALVLIHAENGVFKNPMQITTCPNLPKIFSAQAANCYRSADTRFDEVLVVPGKFSNNQLSAADVLIASATSGNPQMPTALTVDQYSCR